MRSVAAHVGFLTVTLVLAWLVWTREEAGETRTSAQEDESENVPIFDVQSEAFRKISFDSERRKVTVTVEGRGKARSFDVSTYRKDERRRPRPRPRPPAADAGPDAGAAPAADAGPEIEVVETRRRFSGSREVDTYVEKVAPLLAKRSLGVLRRGLLKEFELDEPRATIELDAGDRKLTLEVGGSTFGSSDTYVRDRRTKRVYLVAANVVRDLEYAETRFMQRDLVRAEKEDIAKVVVSKGERRRTLAQQNRASKRGSSWTDEATPQTKNELYDNWMGRLTRLRALEYLEPDEEPRAEGMSAPPVPVLTIEYFGDEGTLGRAEIVKLETEPAEYFARSDATRGWVKLSATLAEQMERDIDSILQ